MERGKPLTLRSYNLRNVDMENVKYNISLQW